MRHTAESKAHLSEMRKGDKNPFFGRKHTPETKAKLAKILRENRPGVGFGLSPGKVRIPEGVALGYFAGLVDGEGSVRFIRKIRPFVAVYNTEKRIMDWLQENVGGKASEVKARKGRKPMWHWRIDATRDVYKICVSIRHLLLAKQDDADIVIRFLETKYGEVIHG
jgi:hypothetical protein